MLETGANYPDGSDSPQIARGGPEARPPACQVCGRQDESLRLVVVPYVISALVVTLRRAWPGMFCWRHRVIRQALAGLITAAFGWWGIPWGFIYTPAALFKLARGGDQPADANAEMLSTLAEYKRQKGEPLAALAIAREALKMQESEGLRQQVLELYKDHPLSITRPGPVSPLPFLVTLAGAAATGIAIGVLDQLITSFLNFFLGGEVHLLVALLSWAPLVAMAFTGGLVVAELVRRAIESTRMENMLLAQVTALMAAALAWYGIPQGSLIENFISALIGGYPLGSIGGFIQTAGEVITQGGLWMISDSLRAQGGFGVIYLGILLVTAVYYLLVAVGTARESVNWLVRLELVEGQLLEQPERSLFPAWAAVGGIALVLALASLVFFDPASLTGGSPEVAAQFEQADALYNQGDLPGAADAYRAIIALDPALPEAHLSLAWTLYGMGDLQGAAGAFEEAERLAPQLADTQLGLGYVRLALGDMPGAESAFQSALQNNGEPYVAGQAYYGLGTIADSRYDTDAAIAYYEEAVRQDWSLTYAHLDLGLGYFGKGEFERAVEKGNDLLGLAPDWAATHVLLAMAYHQLDRPDKVSAERAWAEDSDPQDVYSMMLMGSLYYWLRDFDPAQAILESAHQEYAESGGPVNMLSIVYAVTGRTAQANQLLDEYESLVPGTALVPQARAYVRLQQGDLQEAASLLEQALALEPQNPVTLRDLSFVRFQQGEMEPALQLAEQSLAIYPYDAAALSDKAFALRALGRLDEARAAAEQAVRLSPKSDLPYFILGVCYLDLGQADLGAEQLRRFVELTWDRAYVRDYAAQAQAFLATLP